MIFDEFASSCSSSATSSDDIQPLNGSQHVGVSTLLVVKHLQKTSSSGLDTNNARKMSN
jgi:hypothetical protein